MKKLLCTILLLNSLCLTYAQEIDSTSRINDILFHYGFLDYGAEYYVVDSKNSFLEHHILYQPFLSEENIVNIEFGLVNSFLENGNYTSPSDLSITYQHNFKSSKYKEWGYQGLGASIKMTLPTGRAEYFSGFNSYTIEPLIGTQWLFENTDWFTSIQVRYNYSFASLPGEEPRYSFLRCEYFIGYENNNMWLFVSPDYRFIPSKSNHDLFLTLNGALKVSKRVGLRAKYTGRLIGEEFYRSLLVLGCYVNL